jgi:hypothetical protein
VTGRDSVPVAISIVVAVPVAAPEPVSTEALSGEALSVEAAALEVTALEAAIASTIEVAAPETPALRRSRVLSRGRVYAGCSEGG